MTAHPTPRVDARRKRARDLSAQGLATRGSVHWNLVLPQLLQAAIQRGEGELADGGPFVAITTPHTGRSPDDKFVVRDPVTEHDIDWGKVNQPMSQAHFDALFTDVRAHLGAHRDLFVQDLFCGAHAVHRLSVRCVTPSAWHAAFVRNMFIRPDAGALASFRPNFTVLHAPGMRSDPTRHGTRTGTFIVINLLQRVILIGGTRYAGELKKAMFTVMNYLMPDSGVLSMHCSANIGPAGDTALFFGLSGTGKTTLSADPGRALIGDDEHGWGTDGVFNFEGGCYAKVINLSPEGEPDIYATTRMFGTILENVVLGREQRVAFADASITENTRASYPLHYIRNHAADGRGGHPANVIFLTADAFGVLPPISRLTPQQAMYWFLSGYTAKVAGTERGVTEPQATFSACFGGVFLVWPPAKYATMLGDKLREHDSRVWLLNTGWTGGGYGVGRRMDLAHTRAMVRAILSGALDDVETVTHPVFRLAMPVAMEGIPDGVLDPRKTWADAEAYDAQAGKLAAMFRKNIERFAGLDRDVVAAGP